MVIKYFLILNILFFSLSCGSPDTSSIYVDINQPYITHIVPGDKELTVHFEAQNDEEGFSGYNVSYGDNVDQKKFRLLNDKFLFPTITATRSEIVNKYEFTIKTGQNYSNEDGTGQLDGGDIANGLPRYVVVTGYDLFNNRESSYSYDDFVYMGCPRPDIIGKTVNVNEPFDGISIPGYDLNLATLVNNGSVLQIAPVASGGIQIRSATSIDDINVPPLEGYVSSPITAQKQRLYLVEILGGDGKTYYGKIYIKSVGASSVVADYAIQTSSGITNY